MPSLEADNLDSELAVPAEQCTGSVSRDMRVSSPPGADNAPVQLSLQPTAVHHPCDEPGGTGNPYQLAPDALECVQQWLLWDDTVNSGLAVSNTCRNNSFISDSCLKAQNRASIVDSSGAMKTSQAVPGAEAAACMQQASAQPCNAGSAAAASYACSATAAADTAAALTEAAVGYGAGDTERFWGSRGPTAEEVVAAAAEPVDSLQPVSTQHVHLGGLARISGEQAKASRFIASAAAAEATGGMAGESNPPAWALATVL